MTYSIKPLKLSQNRLPLQFGIIVPTVDKYGNKIKPSTFTERVKSEKKFLDTLFKGDTSVKTLGSYLDKKHKVISEKGSMIEISTTPNVFEENRHKIEKHIKDRKEKWRQDSIFYKIENESFIYPYQKQIPTIKSKDDILIT